jgi:GT2 family glycosyltransferase
MPVTDRAEEPQPSEATIIEVMTSVRPLARPRRLDDWWVIIVAYNRYDLVETSAAAFLAQNPSPARVLVVDNSDAPDQAVVTRLGLDWIPGHDTAGRNSGSAGGFAVGMDYAFGQGAAYVVLSDQDFVPHPDLLGSLWDTAVEHPSAVVSSFTVDSTTNQVVPAYLASAPGQGSNQLCLAPNRHEMVRSLGWRITRTKFRSVGDIQDYAGTCGTDMLRAPVAFPQGLAVPRDIHRTVGTFRREFFVGWEDYEFCCRLQDRGYLLLVAPGAVGHHHLSWHRTIRLGPFSLKVFDNDPSRFYFHVRNSIVMARERAQGPLFARWMLRLGYHSANYLALGPRSARERAGAIWHAWRSGLAHHGVGAALSPTVRLPKRHAR